MTSRREVLAAVLLAAVAAACGRESAPAKKIQVTPSSRPPPIHPPPVEATTYAVDGMTAFGAELFGVVADPAKNAVLSPLSIAYAFGMARVGARGETAAQIDAVLGYPSNPHLALNRITKDIVTTSAIPPKNKEKRKPGDKPGQPIAAIANGLFVQREVELVRSFVDTLAAEYGAEAQRVDFRDDAKERIDAWVREQTAERIDKLFDKLDPETKLVLANAIYLKADWAKSFGQDPTLDEEFRTPAGKIAVPMMHSSDPRRYAESADWQAGEVPYFGGELVMWILVPRGKAAPASLLAPAVLGSVGAKLKPAAIALSLPRWDFATNLGLIPPLREFGMTAPFDNADFSGMLPGIFIGDVVHRANITVDESGTEAAAVTGIAGLSSGIASPTIVLRADHPFAFAIMHLPTKTPLFVGQVVDPTSKGDAA
jgi:serpin B